MIYPGGKYMICLLQILIVAMLHTAAAENKSEFDASAYESYILIKGSSNINDFQLVNENPDLKNFNLKDLINSYGHKDSFEKIRIEVKEFICDKKKLCNDFQEMLSASEFPFIDISLKRRDLSNRSADEELFNLETKISIAGVTRTYLIPCRIIQFSNTKFELNGSKTISLTDFYLDPPKKVLGIIKISNDVFINFAIRFTVNDLNLDNLCLKKGSIEDYISSK